MFLKPDSVSRQAQASPASPAPRITRRGSFELGEEDLFWMDGMLVMDPLSEKKKAPQGAFFSMCHTEDFMQLNLLLCSPLGQFPHGKDDIPDNRFFFV